MSKVFGIGMFKTGTTTLGAALDALGFRTYNGPWKDQSRCPWHPWGADMDHFRPYRESICQLVDQFDAMEDYPFMFIYPLLDEWYPGSKFILTTRDADAVADSDIHMWRALGVREKEIPDKRRFVERCHRHHAAVLAYFEGRRDLLLVDWTQGDGWPQLCSFLNLPHPKTPFPHANARIDEKDLPLGRRVRNAAKRAMWWRRRRAL